MTIELNDKRTAPTGFSTGTPAQASTADEVLVQPLTTYMEGSRFVGPSDEPYLVPRHYAADLTRSNFAKIIKPPVAVEQQPEPLADDADVDAAPFDEIIPPRAPTPAPMPDQPTLSTVPALPGAQPTPAVKAPVRRGRPPGKSKV